MKCVHNVTLWRFRISVLLNAGTSRAVLLSNMQRNETNNTSVAMETQL